MKTDKTLGKEIHKWLSQKGVETPMVSELKHNSQKSGRQFGCHR